MVGSEDLITPSKLSQELAAAIKDSELKIIEGAGHFIFLETPERFNQIVLAFLEGHA